MCGFIGAAVLEWIRSDCAMFMQALHCQIVEFIWVKMPTLMQSSPWAGHASQGFATLSMAWPE